MNRIIWVVLVLMVVSMQVGCESSPSMVEGDAAPSEPTAAAQSYSQSLLIDTLNAKKLGYTVRWATDLQMPRRGSQAHIESLGEAIVCVDPTTNMVTAVSMEDGRFLWSRVVGQKDDRLFAPVRAGNLVVINSETTFYTFTLETGFPKAVHPLKATVNQAPVVVEQHAIFCGNNHQVFAHDVNSGQAKWAYRMTERFFVRPVISGPNVFVVDGHGAYAMLAAATGQLQWKGRVFDRVSAQPAISPLGIFVASEDHSLYAMNRATGRDRWVYPMTQPLTQSPTIMGQMLLLPLPGHGLLAIDERSGSELWRLPHQAQPVMRIGDTLLLNDTVSLLLVESQSGLPVEEIPVQPLRTVILGDQNQLILISESGRLLRLDPLT